MLSVHGTAKQMQGALRRAFVFGCPSTTGSWALIATNYRDCGLEPTR